MWRLRHSGHAAHLAALMMLLAAAGTGRAPAQDAPPAPQAAAPTYLLDVQVNGWPLGLVARFVEQNGRLRIPAEQFDGLGFRLPPDKVVTIDGERWLWLDTVPGLAWKIDRQEQAIDITAPFAALRPTELHIAPGLPRIEARADWGAMLAWDAFGQWSPRAHDPLFSRSWSVNLEGRLFSPGFTAYTRGVVYGGEDADTRFLRLESWADFDDPGHSWRLRLGDSYTGGPSWARTLRFGGLQWSRNFALRPDLVTTPMPVLTREVGVPSTLDLLINGVQRYSQPVKPGLVRLRDLPVVSGTNAIRTVIVDRQGRRTELVAPFYVASDLLAKGMTDFDVELGFPRQRYDLVSNDYGPVFASGAVRHGIGNRVTLQGYAAAARGFAIVSAGATAALGNFAVIDGALIASRAGGVGGWGFSAAASRITPRYNFSASYIRSFSATDLAGWFGYSRILERATGSFGLNLGRAGQVNLVYGRLRTGGGSLSSIASGSWGIDIGSRRRMHVSASGYADLASGGWGAFLSLSLPLGRHTQGFAQQGWADGKSRTELQFQGQGFDSRLNWQLNGATGQGQGHTLDASASWDGAAADLFARATRIDDSTGFQGELMQSLVLMDGQLFLTGRIDDGFTVVDVPDSAGVRVALENRIVGRTGKSGHILLTDLQSWLPNAISIDPLDLPVDASIADTSQLVAPRGGAGTVTRFAVTRARSAVVVLTLPGGTAPPAGATVRLAGSDFTAPLGFGGEVYVHGLRTGANRLDLAWRDGACTARFTADVIEGTLPRLGPVPCVP